VSAVASLVLQRTNPVKIPAAPRTKFHRLYSSAINFPSSA
jgi:hypothetical protein